LNIIITGHLILPRTDTRFTRHLRGNE